jgi:hypothetical protein
MEENILTLQKDSNLVHSIVKAMLEGHSDDDIVKNVVDLSKKKLASKGILITTPEALRSLAQNLTKSLNFVAEKIEGIKEEKQTDIVQEIKVADIWDAFKHDKQTNKISGTLRIEMNEDFTSLKQASKINIGKEKVVELKKKAFEYLKKEYPTLKASLDNKIFKSNLIFKDIVTGIAEVKYEIENAY